MQISSTNIAQYPTLAAMSKYHCLPKFYLVKVLKRGSVAVAKAARSATRQQGGCVLPNPSEIAGLVDELKHITGVFGEHMAPFVLAVDGFVFRLPAPPQRFAKMLAPDFYVGHYGCWGLMVLVICDLRGRIVHVTKPYAAGEQHIAQHVGLFAWLKNVETQTGTRVGILTDGLYTLNHTSGKKKTAHKGETVSHLFTLSYRGLQRLKQLLEFKDWHDKAIQAVHTTASASLLRVPVENVNRFFRAFGITRSGVTFRAKFWKFLMHKGHSHYIPMPLDIVTSLAWLINLRMRLTRRTRVRPAGCRSARLRSATCPTTSSRATRSLPRRSPATAAP